MAQLALQAKATVYPESWGLSSLRQEAYQKVMITTERSALASFTVKDLPVFSREGRERHDADAVACGLMRTEAGSCIFSLHHMHFSYGCMVTDIDCIIVFWSNNKNLNLALFIFWLQKVSFLVAFKG